jgi:hypothetical protein
MPAVTARAVPDTRADANRGAIVAGPVVDN